ncbi:MAG: LysE family transporter [Puniceicoccales bacterium]|jgi:putative LysE/RhtB family amino acid efflux pump|nr:LysE family transporter [Puniceicoccales bacterium]
MSFYFFIKSWVLGFIIAAPIGPIGMLCIRKSLEHGMAGAFSVAIGATCGDATYGFVAAFGIGIIAHFFTQHVCLIQLFSGFFLLYFAIKELQRPHPSPTQSVRFRGILRFSAIVFLLTLSNPMTILPFISIFASISSETRSIGESLMLVTGIASGSLTWWLLLGCTVALLKSRLPNSYIRKIRYLSAATIGAFGVWALIGGLRFFSNSH